MNQIQLLNLIQKLFVALGGVIGGASLSLNSQSEIHPRQLLVGAAMAAFGYVWSHITHATPETGQPGAGQTLKIGLVLLTVVGLTCFTGCTSTGQGGFTAGIGTNSIFAIERTSTATNRFRLVLPFNPAAVANMFIESDGF